MRLFAIGDLHMSGGDDKPMDVFGSQWDRHIDHISRNWQQNVSDEDVVLIPGDISWAMRLEEARADLERISRLHGRAVLCKGNHDYWWNSISRVRSILPEGMQALQHSAADLGCCVVCGTRGWVFPEANQPLSPEDERIFSREAARLRMALEAARDIAGGRPVVAMTHFPPLLQNSRDTAFSALLEEYGVHSTVYGHLHGEGIRNGFTGEHRGVRYYLVSCDGIGFSPIQIPLE